MIYLLQPPGAAARSGGFRFNQLIGEHLQRADTGRVVEAQPEALPQEAERLATDDPGCVLVFDSIYFGALRPRPWLPRLGTPTRLMVHYLPSRNIELGEDERRELEATEAAWLTAVDSVMCAAIGASRWLETRYPELRIRAVLPGIDAAFAATGSPRRDAPLTVVSVGNLLPDKGQAQVAATLAATGRPCRLVLVGDDTVDSAYTDSVEQAAQGIELIRTGWVPTAEVAHHLGEADLYACASSHECFSTAAIEATAAGLPVLSYAVGDITEWVHDGENGVLVQAGDRTAFADRLTELVQHPETLAALRRTPPHDSFPTWDQAAESFVAACRPIRTGGVRPYASCELPTRFGSFDVEIYRLENGEEALMIRRGDLAGGEAAFVRIHSECFTGEVLGSLRCDCKEQLQQALREIAERGRGAVIYLRQEGRGIGLGNKIRAYAEQARGADTIEANANLGFPTDLRDFRVAASILHAHGVTRVQLQTNNPAKLRGLQENGITVERAIASLTVPNPHNIEYLRTKARSLGHEQLATVLPDEANSKVTGLLRDPANTLVVLDLDGVIQFGPHVPDNARAFVAELRNAGVPIRFLTNDGFNSRASRQKQLRDAGLEVAIDELYTASYLTARFVREHCEGPILALCGKPGHDELLDLPLTTGADARTVVVGDWFRYYDENRLHAAFTALERGARLVAMHRKRAWPNGDARTIDVGFWVAGLEYCAQQEAVVVAKPAAYAYEKILEDTGFPTERCVMISDEIDPDLMGAERVGITGVLAPGGAIPRDLLAVPAKGRRAE